MAAGIDFFGMAYFGLTGTVVSKLLTGAGMHRRENLVESVNLPVSDEYVLIKIVGRTQ